jgi:hypothetical protein
MIINKDINNTEAECRFPIDFFEFSFLVEACIPPRPIARTMFWHDVINKYYHVLTPNERARLYEWIGRSYFFKLENEDCALFAARFNPANQYRVKVSYAGGSEIDAFKWKDGYFVKKDVSITPEYIVSSLPLGITDVQIKPEPDDALLKSDEEKSRIVQKVLDVPDSFYKGIYFKVEPEELRLFLSKMTGYITAWNEVVTDEIDIDNTIENHTGDCRIWYTSGIYIALEAKQLIMKCDKDNYYKDIFDWLEINIPSLYKKHNL